MGFEGKFSRIKILSVFCDHFVALYKFGRESLLLRGIKDQQISVILNGVPAYEWQGEGGEVESFTTDEHGWTRMNTMRDRSFAEDERSARIAHDGDEGEGEDSRVGLRGELGFAEGEFVVTNVSSLIPRKRLDVTLRAFAAAEDLNHKRVLVLIGSGPEEGALRIMGDDLGISSRLHFLGVRNDVRKILAASDVLLLSSDAEACPMVILEAMSVGLPCISTEAGAATELIHNGTTGFVVQRGGADEMSRCLNMLLRDEKLQEEMREASLLRWKEHFTLRRMVQQHVELYRELVEQ